LTNGLSPKEGKISSYSVKLPYSHAKYDYLQALVDRATELFYEDYSVKTTIHEGLQNKISVLLNNSMDSNITNEIIET